MPFEHFQNKSGLYVLLCKKDGVFLLLAVKVTPLSINHENDLDCNSKKPMAIPEGNLPAGEALNIKYTYSVTFIVRFISSRKYYSYFLFLFFFFILISHVVYLLLFEEGG